MIDTAVILAAGAGVRLGADGVDRPKGFLTLGERPIVEESLLRLGAVGIDRVVVVTGFRREYYDALAGRYPRSITTVYNPRYAESGSLYSLYCARARLRGPFLLLESDIIYEPRALRFLLDGPPDACLLSGPTGAGDEVWVEATPEGCLVGMSKDRSALGAEPAGELVGVSRVSAELFAAMVEYAEKAFQSTLHLDYETDGLVAAARSRPVQCPVVDDLLWAEIDDQRQLSRARNEIYPRLPPV